MVLRIVAFVVIIVVIPSETPVVIGRIVLRRNAKVCCVFCAFTIAFFLLKDTSSGFGIFLFFFAETAPRLGSSRCILRLAVATAIGTVGDIAARALHDFHLSYLSLGGVWIHGTSIIVGHPVGIRR